VRDALQRAAESDSDFFDPFALGDVEAIISTTEAQREVWLGDRLSAEAALA
jgi:hypothetical protein